MIIQLGALFSGLVQGFGGIAKQLLPSALETGAAFLQRELGRKERDRARRQFRAQAVAALNTPGIAVARIGGTVQPVGGRVQRPTFTGAALTPAQQPFGNVPLLPVGGRPVSSADVRGPVFRSFTGAPAPRRMFVPNQTNGLLFQRRTTAPGALGEPRFAQDEMGRTLKFVPDPTGQGFLTLAEASQRNISPMKPHWRFNRLESQWEKIKPRRMNPFNFKASDRAGRRIDRTLDAVKAVLIISKKKDKGVNAGGKTVRFRKKSKKA